MFLASDFASVGAADLIISIFIGISVLALVSFLISLPKLLRKHGRRMRLVSATTSEEAAHFATRLKVALRGDWAAGCRPSVSGDEDIAAPAQACSLHSPSSQNVSLTSDF